MAQHKPARCACIDGSTCQGGFVQQEAAAFFRHSLLLTRSQNEHALKVIHPAHRRPIREPDHRSARRCSARRWPVVPLQASPQLVRRARSRVALPRRAPANQRSVRCRLLRRWASSRLREPAFPPPEVPRRVGPSWQLPGFAPPHFPVAAATSTPSSPLRSTHRWWARRCHWLGRRRASPSGRFFGFDQVFAIERKLVIALTRNHVVPQGETAVELI